MHMTELARRLQERGWEITVYCTKPAYGDDDAGDVPADMTHQGIRIKRMPTIGDQRESLSSRLLLAVTYLVTTIQALVRDRGRYDGMLVTTNPPFIGLAGWVLSKLFGKPYIHLVYDVYPDIAVELGVVERDSMVSHFWERMTRLILDEAAGTVVIGRDMGEIIREKLDRRNWGSIHLIHNWSDERNVKPIPRDENPFREEHQVGERLLVQYAGRHGRTHNLEPLVGAAKQLQDEPVLFQFVGEGNKKEKLQDLAQGLENVMFLPYQPIEELDAVLAAADLAVVCLESRFTGMSVPSKAYGIMASGTPILGFVAEASEIGQTVQETGCGKVLEEPTGRSVAETVRALLKNRGRLNEMGQNGRNAFVRRFTLATAAERYDSVLSRYIYGDIEPPSHPFREEELAISAEEDST